MERSDGYAAAIFEVARAEGVQARVEDEFFRIARAAVESEQLRDALRDPQLPQERKQAILRDLLDGRAHEVTDGFLDFLVGQDRIGELSSIADALVRLGAEAQEKVVAEVRSAIELDQETTERLAAALSKATGKAVSVKVIVDDTVMGGIVARVGDTVIDGSVQRRLREMRDSLEV